MTVVRADGSIAAAPLLGGTSNAQEQAARELLPADHDLLRAEAGDAAGLSDVAGGAAAPTVRGRRPDQYVEPSG